VGKSEDELAIMRRKHIGIVFQFFNLLESMSVLENVTLPAVIAGAPRKRAETRARDLLDLLGLADKAKDAPGVLSGGQRQRLAIARAIVKRPEIYLFDDCFSALDAGTDARLRAALRRETVNATVLIVAQRVSTVMHADRIIVVDDGRIAGIGKHDELIKTSEAYREIVESQLGQAAVA
jgi:ATP-binding cassette subfamily B protein